MDHTKFECETKCPSPDGSGILAGGCGNMLSRAISAAGKIQRTAGTAPENKKNPYLRDIQAI